MSVTDEYNQPSESFWEIGKYSRSVKRIENGSKLCDSLRQLIETRSDIEKSYAKQLSQWSRKWNEFLDKGPEYGTTQAAWRSVLTEADKLCELHTEVAEKLMTNVYLQIKQWNKENYHKTMMNFRESKEKEDNFRRAQKPWMKRYQKVILAKKEYHAACKQEKSTANQENNAKGDPSIPVEQVKKLGEKLQKCRTDVENAREKYTAALHDLNGYNPKYIEEMTFVFNECQEMERKRLMFFKQMLFGIHHCVDLSQDHRFAEIYRQFYQQINCADCEKDLRWWSNIYGAGMSMNWPEFEEYSPELHNITKNKKTNFGSNEGITITSIRHSRDSSYASNSSDNMVPASGPNYLRFAKEVTSKLVTSASSLTKALNGKLKMGRTTDTMIKISESLSGYKLCGGQINDNNKSSRKDRNYDDTLKDRNYDDTLNPFGEEADNEHLDSEDKQTVTQSAEQKKPEGYDESLNPFGEEESDEEDLNNEAKHLVKDAPQKKNAETADDHFADSTNTNSTSATYTTATTTTNTTTTTTNTTTTSDEVKAADGKNPFGDPDGEDWEDEDLTLVDDNRPGVPVRALYDYHETAQDELTFKAGDVFTKLSDADELGWCKGRKDGRVGLYPATYVEPL